MSYGVPVGGQSIPPPNTPPPSSLAPSLGQTKEPEAYGSSMKATPPSPVAEPAMRSTTQGLNGAEEVHTMPQKFLPQTTHKGHMGPFKKFLLVGGTIVLVMLIVTAVVVFIFSRQQTAINQNTNISQTNQTNTNTPTNTNTNSTNSANENTNVASNANTNSSLVNTNTNLNQNSNQDTNINTNTNTNTNTSTEISSTKDSDKDGLTDNEEAIWGASQSKPDTDGDGYLDGNELLAGYSPTGTFLLAEDPNAKTFTNQTYDYTMLFPARWVAGQLDESDEDILLTAETGEFIEVTVTSNSKQQTAKQWYLEQFPDLSSKNVFTFESQGRQGVKSQNGLTAYLATDEAIYVITYNIGTRSSANFLTTFYMMLSSFTIHLDGQATDINSNNTQTPNQ